MTCYSENKNIAASGGKRRKELGSGTLEIYSRFRQNDLFEGFITMFDTRIHSGHKPVHQQLQCTTYFRLVRFTAKYESFEDIALSKYPCLTLLLVGVILCFRFHALFPPWLRAKSQLHLLGTSDI